MAKVMFARLLSTEGFSPRARNALNKDIGKVVMVRGSRYLVKEAVTTGSAGATQYHDEDSLWISPLPRNYELLHD